MRERIIHIFAVVSIAGGSGACREPVDLVLPSVEGAKSALIAIEGNGAANLLLIDLQTKNLRGVHRSDEDRRIVAAFYPWRPSELRLNPGSIAWDASAPDVGPPLPAFIEADVLELTDDDGFDAWVPVPVLDGALSEFRLPSLDAIACLAERRCIVETVCAESCPPLDPLDSPAPPFDPLLPAPPIPVEIDGCAATNPARVFCLPLFEPPPDCALGEAFFVGRGCTRVGSTCPPDGEWSPSAPPEALFVSAGPPGGVGTMLAPFGSINEAILAARGTSATIAIAAGDYYETLLPSSALKLIGACAERTRIISGESEASATIAVGAVRVEVENVAISNASVDCVQVASSGHLELREASIGPCVGSAVAVNFASFGGRALLIRHSMFGVVVNGGALDLKEVAIVESSSDGVIIRDGRTAIDDIAVLDTGLGAAITIEAIAARPEVAIAHAILMRNRGVALTMIGPARLDVDDVSIDQDGFDPGDTISVVRGAAITGRRVAIRTRANTAVHASDLGSIASLEDVILTPKADERRIGSAVYAAGGGRVVLKRSEFSQYVLAVLIQDTGSSVELEDATMMLATSTTALHPGVSVINGGRLEMSRASINHHHNGISIDGGRAEIEDIELEGGIGRSFVANGGILNVSRAKLSGGAGITANLGSEVTLSEVGLGGLRQGIDVGAAIAFGNEASGRMTNVAIEVLHVGLSVGAKAAVVADGLRIHAPDLESTAIAIDDAQLEADHVAIDAAIADTGISAERAMLTLRGASIRGRFQSGLRILDDTRATIERMEVSGAEDAGVDIDGGETSIRRFAIANGRNVGVHLRRGELRLSEGKLETNSIALLVEPIGYELTRLLDRVHFESNGADIGTPDQ